MPSDHERGEHEAPGNATPAGPAGSNAALASRFHQMFPVLSQTEIDRVRRFGEVRRFPAGALLFHAGEAIPGMYVILSGRIAIEPRDGLGQAVPVAAFAQLIEAPVEEMTEVVPGEVIAEIGQLSGRPDVLVRGPGLASTMSRYLIERIAGSPNIAVLGETEVVELLGTVDQGLQGVRWRNRRTGAEEQHAIAHLFVFTGTDPVAAWLNGSGIPIDEKGSSGPVPTCVQLSVRRYRSRPGSRGSSPLATCVAAR